MGDHRSERFTLIYRENYRPVLGYALRRCASPDDAADVVAETFTIAWRKFDELPVGEEARLWLYAVARRVLANHRRGERRHADRAAALREELASLRCVQDPPEGPSAVAAVFRGLPEADRELLAFVMWEGLNRRQIAKVLGCSPNAVSIRLYRARKRFARGLADAGIEHSTAAETPDTRRERSVLS